MFGPRNSTYAVNLTYEIYRHTYIYTYIYISREISIEHPSVGLASHAQLWVWHFVGVFPHEHAQCDTWINYRISRCNFIADWTIVLWKVSIAGLTLATSQLATTDLL